jgi:hypothetical protein
MYIPTPPEKTHDDNQFRSENNTRYTKGLFIETARSPESVIYTLKDRDYKGFPSLYRLYMEEQDDTEYLFATKYLEGWEHWEMLCLCTWFQPFVERWRKEMYLLKTAELLKVIKVEATSAEAKNRFQAAKYLLDREWEQNVPSSKKKKRGRPSKEEVQSELAKEVSEVRRQQEDLNRINGIRRPEGVREAEAPT